MRGRYFVVCPSPNVGIGRHREAPWNYVSLLNNSNSLSPTFPLRTKAAARSRNSLRFYVLPELDGASFLSPLPSAEISAQLAALEFGGEYQDT